MRKHNFSHLASLSLFILLTIVSCRKEEQLFNSKPAELYEAKVATDWAEMFRLLTKKTAGYTPPVAARTLGYMGVTLYETAVIGMPQYQSLSGQLAQFPIIEQPDLSKEYNVEIAINAALGYLARSFYPTAAKEWVLQIQTLEDNTYERTKGVNPAIVERSKAWGLTVAKAIFEWSKTDGGHEGYAKNFPTTYTPPSGDGLWVSTFPKFQKALQPYWGNNRTFIPQCAQNTQPDAPHRYSDKDTSVFHIAALEVFSTVNNLTAEQKTIAKYWSDDPGEAGTPPGHLLSLATIVIQKDKINLAKAVEIYAKVSIGLSDAFVSCWKCKYQHNLLRPISYIRTRVSNDWTSLLETPPFPEYTSGHSVASAATARILSDLLGYKYAFTDNTHEKRPDIAITRSFPSFNAMAAEAAISRLYGGIHYREAIEKGVEQGTRVGIEIGKLNFRKE
jgi:hypothetical protein